MKNHLLKALLLFLFFIFFAPEVLSAQEVYGRIYSKTDADQIYGPVLKKFDIDLATVQALLDQAGDYIMFNYDTDDLLVLDGKRNLIFNRGQLKKILPSDIFKKFSVSVVKDLLSRGSEDKVHVEKRKDVISVTFAESTMEFAQDCPPNCN